MGIARSIPHQTPKKLELLKKSAKIKDYDFH